MEYLKRLNWSGWIITYLLCVLASLARVQDDNLLISVCVGLGFGFIFSLFPLFAGIKPKKSK